MKKKPRQRPVGIFFWAQTVFLTLMLVFGTIYELGQVLSLTSISVLILPFALDLILGFRILLYGSIGYVIVLGYYRRLTRGKKLIEQTLKDRLAQIVAQCVQRMMIKKPARVIILPGFPSAANAGRSRIVVGEKLVRQMNDEQLAGIIGHELAHGMKHHVLVKAMLFPMIVIVGIGLYAFTGSSPTGTILVWTVYAGIIFAEIPLAWKMEYSADLGSAELLGRNTMSGALAQLRETHYDGPSFTHPSLSRRINRLELNQNLQNMTFKVPVLTTAQPFPSQPPIVEKQPVIEKVSEAQSPSYVAETAKPRLCPICGVQAVPGRTRCVACGTNLQSWLAKD